MQEKKRSYMSITMLIADIILKKRKNILLCFVLVFPQDFYIYTTATGKIYT